MQSCGSLTEEVFPLLVNKIFPSFLLMPPTSLHRAFSKFMFIANIRDRFPVEGNIPPASHWSRASKTCHAFNLHFDYLCIFCFSNFTTVILVCFAFLSTLFSFIPPLSLYILLCIYTYLFKCLSVGAPL